MKTYDPLTNMTIGHMLCCGRLGLIVKAEIMKYEETEAATTFLNYQADGNVGRRTARLLNKTEDVLTLCDDVDQDKLLEIVVEVITEQILTWAFG